MFQPMQIDDNYGYVYDYEIKVSDCERDGRNMNKWYSWFQVQKSNLDDDNFYDMFALR